MPIDNGRLEIHTAFRSRHLKHERDIIVYLPRGYETSPERRYPVCYMHDGQNLFDPAIAFAGVDWQLQKVSEELTGQGEIPPLIIVGINNAGVARQFEYTHVSETGRRGGLARAYGRAIVEELKPLIDARYRTLAAAQFTTLGGSSLGGLVSAYLGLRYPAVFGNLILMSPSVWWAQRDILKHIRPPRRAPRPRIWLDIGTDEGPDPERTVEDVRALRDAFLAHGWQLGGDLAYQEEEGAHHNELAWGRRMRPALRFVYAGFATFV